LASAVRALRRWVIFEDGHQQIGKEPLAPEKYVRWSEHVSPDNENDILRWVEISWHDIKRLDKAHKNVPVELERTKPV
jgi:hypothetical protein